MRRTFFTLSRMNGAWVAQFDHDTRNVREFRLNTGTQNDHNVASVGVRSDGKLIVAHCDHNSPMYVRLSSSAGDITTLGSAALVDNSGTGQCTYPKLVHLSDEGTSGRWYLFYRKWTATAGPQWYCTSDDDGATWSSPVQVFDEPTQRPYVKLISNGVDRIDFFMSDKNANSADTSVYHCYYDGAYRDSDGVDMGSLPIGVDTSMTQVYDGSTYSGWMTDCTYRDGEPVVLFPQIRSATDHRLMYASYNGTSWDVSEVTPTGSKLYESADEDSYAAGGCFSSTDDEIYLCREVATDRWELERWTTADAGATWTADTAITSGSASRPVKNYRPMKVEGGGPWEMVWIYGSYSTYISWASTSVVKALQRL
jgi:hypothetical protein